MAKRKRPQEAGDPDRIYRMGGSDPRSGVERLLGAVNRAAQPRAIRRQGRRYDDDEATRARYREAAAAENKRRGVRSSSPKRRRKTT